MTKIYLYDNNSPSESRTVYFQYQNTSDPSESFLQQIIYPNGCTTGYGFVGSEGYGNPERGGRGGVHDVLQLCGVSMNLKKTVEPEGRVTYFTDSAAATPSRPGSRPRGVRRRISLQHRQQRRLHRAVELEARCGERGDDYAYNNDVRITKGIDARQNVTYYQYNSLASLTQEQTAGRRSDDAVRLWLERSGRAEEGRAAERARIFSRVTYYGYDGNRNRICIIDALGNRRIPATIPRPRSEGAGPTRGHRVLQL